MLRRLTFAYSVLFLVVAAVGFAIHGTHSAPATNLFGLFPVNGLHNLVHLVIGLAGMAAVLAGPSACRLYARIVGITYSAVGILGFFSPDAFGLMPIGGADIALHLVAGAVALYLGFSKRLAMQSVGFTPRAGRFLHHGGMAPGGDTNTHAASPRAR